MKYLADENFPISALKLLQAEGIDILPIPLESRRSPDATVLRLALADERVLATFDKDFGELVFKRSAGSLGVILFRLAPAGRKAVVDRVCEILRSSHDFRNALTVVELDRIRVRRLADAFDREE
jgi:predicted nuclease of predicted toxin-antitoxin system